MIGFERIITIFDRIFIVWMNLNGGLQYLIKILCIGFEKDGCNIYLMENSLYDWIWKDGYNIWYRFLVIRRFAGIW